MKLSALRSIGEKREKDFQKLGIYEVEDLVRFYPRAYLDLTERTSLKNAYHNDMVLVACQVNRVTPVNYGSKRKMVKAFCSQDGFPFTVVWFNQPYVASQLKAGEYLFYGRVQNKLGQVSLVNPTFEPMDKNYRLKGIVPVYSLKGGLSQKVVRAAVKEGLQKVDLTTAIPWQIVKKYDLPDLERAYFEVHNPTSHKAKDDASERIALEEYFTLISAFKIMKGGKEEVRTRKYSVQQAK
jgi:ATP-dependent DNA helicase RecG